MSIFWLSNSVVVKSFESKSLVYGFNLIAKKFRMEGVKEFRSSRLKCGETDLKWIVVNDNMFDYVFEL